MLIVFTICVDTETLTDHIYLEKLSAISLKKNGLSKPVSCSCSAPVVIEDEAEVPVHKDGVHELPNGDVKEGVQHPANAVRDLRKHGEPVSVTRTP